MGMVLDPMISVSEILSHVSMSLSEKPFKAYVLLDAEAKIEELSERFLEPEVKFFDFFFKTLRHHIWVHISSDASTIVSDEKIERIILTIGNGLSELSKALSEKNESSKYQAMIALVSDYLSELERGE